MKSLVLPGIPPPHTSFGKHRFNSDLSRFSLSLSVTSPRSPRPALGSPYLSPPMSGSPPSTDPLPSPQVQFQPRRRTESPPRTQIGAITALSVSQEQQRLGQVTQPLGASFPEPGATRTSRSFDLGPNVTRGIQGTGPSERTLPTTVPIQEPIASLQRSYSERVGGAARRTKAHVASACVNCKKKHLRCDQGRPCRRCVQAGKEDSCVDVQHKKRGRPPLRPGDSPSTAFSSGPGRSQPPLPASYLAPGEDPANRGRGPSLRPIRPGTGTQSPGAHEFSHGQRYSQQYPWQSPPSSSAVARSPPYSFTSASTRPFTTAPAHPESYYPASSYRTPSAGFVPIDVPRSYAQPTSYFPPTQPTQFPQFSSPQLSYGAVYQPTTRSPTRPPISEPTSRETTRYRPEYLGPHLAPIQPGAVEQAQRQAQQMRPEQFFESPQTRQRRTQHPPEQPSTPATRQREEEEDPNERSSKRRKMNIGDILER